MRSYGQNYKPETELDMEEGRNTIESRLDDIKYAVSNIEAWRITFTASCLGLNRHKVNHSQVQRHPSTTRS